MRSSPSATSSSPSSASRSRRKDGQTHAEARKTVTIIGLGIFCTTFGQPIVAGGYPIRYFLKDHLHLNASQVSSFFLVATLFWYIKPLAGIITDCFPFLGTRRKHYLAVSALGALAFWAVTAFVRYDYWLFLVSALILNGFLVLGSTVSGALLVEEAQAIQATGRLSAMRQFLSSVALLIAGPAGIWAYDHFLFRGTALLIAASFLPLALGSFFLLPKETVANGPGGMAKFSDKIRNELQVLLRTKLLWVTAGMWALVVIAPGFGTLLVFRQTDILHFSHEFVAELAFATAAGGIIMSMIYGGICRVIPLRYLLPGSILLSAGGSLLYLHYDAHTALWVDGLNGGLGVLALLPLFDMAARATPKHVAGLGYALIMSVNNIVSQASDKIGTTLSVQFHFHFHDLVWLNALTTLAALIAVPFLPSTLLSGRDA